MINSIQKCEKHTNCRTLKKVYSVFRITYFWQPSPAINSCKGFITIYNIDTIQNKLQIENSLKVKSSKLYTQSVFYSQRKLL